MPKQDYDLSLCVSLLSMLDFHGNHRVTREDWRRGTRAMALHDMGEDDNLWHKLLQKFGSHDAQRGETIDLRTIEDFVPIDPRVSLLLKAMFASVATLSDSMLQAQKKLATADDIKNSRVVLNLRIRLLQPVYTAWRDQFRKEKALRFKVMKRMSQRGVTRGWLQWVGIVEERRRLRRFMMRAVRGEVTHAWYRWLETLESQARLGRVMRRALNAGLARAFDAWLEQRAAMHKLRRFLKRGTLHALKRGQGCSNTMGR